jgi:hypothetical protein
METISGLKLGAEQRVGDIKTNTIVMTIVTAARSTISGTELRLDRAVDTIQMTTKMTTTTTSGTAMVTEQAKMSIATQSPTRKSTMMTRCHAPAKQVSSRFGTCAAVGGVLTLRERSRSS